eukprot:scaffold1147_cov172-Amphora_coffeaeformis.AAC.16
MSVDNNDVHGRAQPTIGIPGWQDGIFGMYVPIKTSRRFCAPRIPSPQKDPGPRGADTKCTIPYRTKHKTKPHV